MGVLTGVLRAIFSTGTAPGARGGGAQHPPAPPTLRPYELSNNKMAMVDG